MLRNASNSGIFGIIAAITSIFIQDRRQKGITKFVALIHWHDPLSERATQAYQDVITLIGSKTPLPSYPTRLFEHFSLKMWNGLAYPQGGRYLG